MSRPVRVLVALALLAGPPGMLLGLGALGPAATASGCPLASDSPSTPTPSDDTGPGTGADLPETTRIVWPLPQGSFSVSDSYGWRTDPFTGQPAFHAGTDLPASAGTQVLAVADGVVERTSYLAGGWGNYVVLAHNVDGAPVASLYAHLRDGGTHVMVGQQVHAGDWIADVGSTGRSTGPHLHLEIHPGGWGHPTVDPLTWLTDRNAAGAPAAPAPAGCQSEDPS